MTTKSVNLRRKGNKKKGKKTPIKKCSSSSSSSKKKAKNISQKQNPTDVGQDNDNSLGVFDFIDLPETSDDSLPESLPDLPEGNLDEYSPSSKTEFEEMCEDICDPLMQMVRPFIPVRPSTAIETDSTWLYLICGLVFLNRNRHTLG